MDAIPIVGRVVVEYIVIAGIPQIDAIIIIRNVVVEYVIIPRIPRQTYAANPFVQIDVIVEYIVIP